MNIMKSTVLYFDAVKGFLNTHLMHAEAQLRVEENLQHSHLPTSIPMLQHI